MNMNMDMFGRGVDDSDESISDEEDLDVDNSGNRDVDNSGNRAVSLGSCSENKGRSIPLLSQIETLEKAYCESNRATNTRSSREERRAGLCIEDEIEFPVFINEDTLIPSPNMSPVLNTVDGFTCFNGLISTCDSDEDNICQEKVSCSFRYPKRGRGRGRDAWSEASKEVEALAQCEKTGLSLTNGSSSKRNKSFKGGRGKVQTKFTFQSGSCKGEYFPPESRKNTGVYPADVLETKVFSPGDSKTELPDDLGGLKVEQLANCDDHREHSVAELLDSLQGRNIVPHENSETRRWRGKRKASFKRNSILVDDTDMDEDMLMNVWSSSSEEDDGPRGASEEDDSLNRQAAFPRSMVDHFQVVFDAVSPKYHEAKAMFERQSGNALFERLQNVLLIQKEADMDFLKKSELDLNLMEEGCLDVKILSRSLEAKLTVCCCSFQGEGDKEKILTVMFNSRACNGVELEVGNLIRIHPLWKEVNIKGEDEAVILSTYFSKM